MPSPGTPCVLLIVSCGCHKKNKWRPPRGVTLVSVAGTSPLRAMSSDQIGKPLMPLIGSTSMSSTQTPEISPVGMPIMASGKRAHQARTCASSRLASLNPCTVNGRLSSGLQGNTGMRSFSA
jgi:hypothetical protein